MRSMRHTAMVPKGFLRYQVLKLLNENPMSGSEIMNEIEGQTDGRWRPSPGSIYPLLAWLQDNEYLKEADGEAGVKRYALTEKGKAFLEEQNNTQERLGRRFMHIGPGPGFMGPPWRDFFPDRASVLRKPAIDLAMALWNFNDALRRRYSEEAVEEARKALEESVEKIEAMTKKLEEPARLPGEATVVEDSTGSSTVN